MLHDRYGSEIGPFLKKGHPMQSGETCVGPDGRHRSPMISHFLRKQLNDTLRGSPVFTVQNILTGDPKGGSGVLQRRRQVQRVPFADTAISRASASKIRDGRHSAAHAVSGWRPRRRAAAAPNRPQAPCGVTVIAARRCPGVRRARAHGRLRRLPAGSARASIAASSGRRRSRWRRPIRSRRIMPCSTRLPTRRFTISSRTWRH